MTSSLAAPEPVREEDDRSPDDVCADDDSDSNQVDNKDRIKRAGRWNTGRVGKDGNSILDGGNSILLRNRRNVDPLREVGRDKRTVDRGRQGDERFEVRGGRIGTEERVQLNGLVVRRHFAVDIIDSGKSGCRQFRARRVSQVDDGLVDVVVVKQPERPGEIEHKVDVVRGIVDL